MTYPCTDCILDHMAASGPQTRQDLRTECRTQAVPYDNILFAAAVDGLLASGRIVIDDDQSDDRNTTFDFPDSYYTGLQAELKARHGTSLADRTVCRAF